MASVIILAAGQGTRLKPLTDNKPKCLVKLGGKTILDYQLEVFKQCDIKNIHIVTGFCNEQLTSSDYSTSVNDEYLNTNMVASLFSAKEHLELLGQNDLIISYGDIIFQKNNLAKLMMNDCDISIMIDDNWKEYWQIRMANPLKDAETLIIDENNYIKEIGKVPTDYSNIHGQYTGLFKIKSDKIRAFVDLYYQLDTDRLYDGNNFDNMYMTTYLQLLIEKGWNLSAVHVKNGWLEVDTVEDLQLYEKLLRLGKLDKYFKS
jgi:L-glutamine-phosphate cytidylyltransferase